MIDLLKIDNLLFELGVILIELGVILIELINEAKHLTLVSRGSISFPRAFVLHTQLVFELSDLLSELKYLVLLHFRLVFELSNLLSELLVFFDLFFHIVLIFPQLFNHFPKLSY